MTFDLCKKYNEKQAEFYFTKDTSFKIGDAKFETYYPGEGHTKDNIVIWFDQQKILYGACFVKSTDNNSLGYITDANLKAWPQSVKNVLAKYHPDYVIPGHFSWQNKNSLLHTLALLQTAK
jgi:metallo-beta-lactamase class B